MKKQATSPIHLPPSWEKVLFYGIRTGTCAGLVGALELGRWAKNRYDRTKQESKLIEETHAMMLQLKEEKKGS